MLRLPSYVAEISSILDLSALVRGRRQALGLSQEELANRANVSRQWISAFELGRPGSELRLILRLLEALELRLSVDPLDAMQKEHQSRPDGVDLDALLEAHRESQDQDNRGR
jgi:transcriptional regulator with XRE-family HTH domain